MYYEMEKINLARLPRLLGFFYFFIFFMRKKFLAQSPLKARRMPEDYLRRIFSRHPVIGTGEHGSLSSGIKLGVISGGSCLRIRLVLHC